MCKKLFTTCCSVVVGMLMCLLVAKEVSAQTWMDSLYVRINDAHVNRPTDTSAIVIFNLQVYRPVAAWNNNDTTLCASDFVFGKAGKDLGSVFVAEKITAEPLHPSIVTDPNGALHLNARIVLGKLQVSLTPGKNAQNGIKLPFREWVNICKLELPLAKASTVELGLVWDRTSTGFITKGNIPILEVLQDSLNKIPDKVLNFEDYSSSRKVCSGEEFFLFAHAVSSGTGLKSTWKYSLDGGSTFSDLGSTSAWRDVAAAGFKYKMQGEQSDTLWLGKVPVGVSGIVFKCVAEDPTVSATPRETEGMVLTVMPEVKVALEGSTSIKNLGRSGDTLRSCSGDKAVMRVAFYDLQNKTQIRNLKEMGGKVHVVYRWIDRFGGTGEDTLSVNMEYIAATQSSFNSGIVLFSDSTKLTVTEEGKYYIHKVWTDSCGLGTVLTAYDTVVVKQGSNAIREFETHDYIAGSGDWDATADLDGMTFEGGISVKSPAIGLCINGVYDAPAGKVGTDTLLYTYNSGGCTITAVRQVNVLSGKKVAIKVLLEGPYITRADSMRCLYVDNFPKIVDRFVSPYADKKECLAPFPKFDRGIVDWIYVEVWDYPPTGSGIGDLKKGNLVDSTSALLLSDGTVCSVKGEKYVSFNHLKDDKYYVVIKHRNHVPVMSAKMVTFTSGTVTATNMIDFTQKMENAYDNAGVTSKQPPLKMVNGKCLMYAGDLNGDALINVKDAVIAKINVNKIGYDIGDVSLDARVTVADKNMVKANSYIYKKF